MQKKCTDKNYEKNIQTIPKSQRSLSLHWNLEELLIVFVI